LVGGEGICGRICGNPEEVERRQLGRRRKRKGKRKRRRHAKLKKRI